MKRQLAIGLIACLLGGTACWPFDEDQLAEMTLKRVKGLIQVQRGEEQIEVSSETSLEPGDVVITGRDASAVLRLGGERRVQLASTTRARIIGESAIAGESGKLLADTRESIRVVIGDVEARASKAVFRIDRGLGSTRAGIYEGRVQLSAPGEDGVTVGRLHEASVAAGDLPSLPDPYTLRQDDPWDQLFLGDLLGLDSELSQQAAGFAPQLDAGDKPGLAYFSALAGGADVSFMRPYLRRASPVDLVIGFIVATRAPGSLRDAFLEALDLFEDGASWAVVAGILNVRPNPLLADLGKVIEGTGAVAEDGGSAEFSIAAAQDTIGSAPPSDDGGGSGDTGADEPPNQDGDGQAAPPGDEGGGGDPGDGDGGDGDGGGGGNEEAQDCQNVADCTIKDLTEDEPQPEPSPSGPPVDVPIKP